MSLNKVQLIGNLGKRPYDGLEQTEGGNSVVTLDICVQENYKDKNGTWIDNEVWHSVRVFGQLATSQTIQLLNKGDMVYVEGKLTQYTREGKNGTEYKTGVNGFRVKRLRDITKSPNINKDKYQNGEETTTKKSTSKKKKDVPF